MKTADRKEMARKRHHARVLEAKIRASKRRLSESEEKQAIVTFVALPNFKYTQNNLSDEAFEYNFDDMILYNSYYDFDPNKEVSEMVKADFDEFGEKGLAQYIDDYEGELGNYVESITGRFDSKKGELHLTCKLTAGTNPYKIIIASNNQEKTIIDALSDYLEGQISDGWGEGFEQQEVTARTIYAVYNEDDDTDCEFFSRESAAVESCSEKNDYSESGDYDEDDDEYEDESPTYDWCPVDVSVYCSFWSRGEKTFVKTLVNGFDAEGYDENGYNKQGFDRTGRDKDGYDVEGYNYQNRDRDGFDREGFDRNGLDREGFNKSGKKDISDTRPTYGSSGKKQGALFQRDKSGKITIKNTFDMGEAVKKGKKKIVKEAIDPEMSAEEAIDLASMFRFDMLKDTVFTDAECYASSDCTEFDYQDCLNDVFPTFLGITTVDDAVKVLEIAKEAGDLDAAENLEILKTSHSIVYGA